MSWNDIWGGLGIVTTIFVARHFLVLPRLKYSFEILPFVSPKDVDKTIKNKLKILYDNQEVSKLSIAKIVIYNKGWGVAENFSYPVNIKFNSKILAAYSGKEFFASGIADAYVISKDFKSIEFTPNYINPKENIVFNVVVETVDNIDVKIKGRCKGCSKIRKIISYLKIKHLCLCFIFFLLGVTTAFLMGFWQGRNAKKIENMERVIQYYQDHCSITVSEILTKLQEQDEKNM